MRNGFNPNVEASAPKLPAVLGVVITHLPHREGYHAQRFEIIQACIESMRQNAGIELPLYVWDNGSDHGFQKWLTNELMPDYLTLSPNVGKATARTMIIRSLPPETIVCFSDDDLYYSPGWFSPQREILEAFPKVGVVSGCPIRTQARWGIDTTLAWAEKNAHTTRGRFIPDEWECDFCVSIGRDYVTHKQDTDQEQDTLIEYGSLRALAGAHHMQFIAYAGRLAPLALWSPRLMRAEKTFDTFVDRMGLLRLFTTGRYVRHMGNVLDADLRLNLEIKCQNTAIAAR